MNGASWNTAYSLMGELAENPTVTQNELYPAFSILQALECNLFHLLVKFFKLKLWIAQLCLNCVTLLK